MKKTYINPVLNVIEIKATHQLLAGSETSTPIVSGNATEWGSRGGSFDFDDEDEDW